MGEDDFEFDFFAEERPVAASDEWGDDSWEGEASEPRQHPGPAVDRQPSPQIVLRRRLAAAAVVALLLVIILVVVLTQGSGGGGGPYQRYLAALSPIAADSQQTGASLAATLAAKPAGARGGATTKLDALLQRSINNIARLQATTPPAALQTEQGQAIAALDLRLQGLQGIRDSLPQAIASQVPRTWIPVLSLQVDQLVSSDAIWDSLVRTRVNSVLQAKGIGGAFAPQSRFVTDRSSLLKSIKELLLPTLSTNNTPNLALGAKGTEVVTWQNKLNEWLHLTAPTRTPLTPDGTFGPATVAATQALQTAQGLTPDGVVGPKTRQALETALAGQTAATTKTG